MSTYYKENMLFQTFIELDTQISGLARRISSNRFVEIGDDPNLVRDIESVLLRVRGKVKAIEPFFDLRITPLSKANTYFALIMRVNDVLKYLQEVRRKDYGSRQHTRELLEKLNDCVNSIYDVSDIIGMTAEKIH